MPGENRRKVFVKVHRSQNEVLVAMCDSSILGRSFREGQFKLRISEGFYGGTLMDVDDCESLLKEATIANFVGNDSVSKAISLRLVDRKNVMVIAGVPHAQMVKIFM